MFSEIPFRGKPLAAVLADFVTPFLVDGSEVPA